MRKEDKKQVIGEEIGDDRSSCSLSVEPVDATPPSLHKLVKDLPYCLRIDDFERFIGFCFVLRRVMA
jgi:hypothetical protein